MLVSGDCGEGNGWLKNKVVEMAIRALGLSKTVANAKLPAKMFGMQFCKEHKEETEKIADGILKRGMDAAIKVLLGLGRRTGLAEVTQKVRIPALLICGAEDEKALANARVLLASLPEPNIVTAVVKGSGHAPQLERHAVFNLLLSEFVKQVEATGKFGGFAATSDGFTLMDMSARV